MSGRRTSGTSRRSLGVQVLAHPEGPERHLDAARQKLPRDIFAAQLPRNYPHHRGNFEREKNVLYCGGEVILEAFYETIWARVIESQKLPRDSGESIFAARHQYVSQGPLGRELKNIYHHHPESKKRNSSEQKSGSIQPYGRYGNAGKTSNTISTIAILWPVKAIFEKRAATVEVDTFFSPVAVFSFIFWGKSQFKKCLGKHMEVPDILLPDICGLPPCQVCFVTKGSKA